MADAANPLDVLDRLDEASRIRSRRLKSGIAIIVADATGGIATIVADATGLGASDRAALESRIKAAASDIAGVEEVRVALTASQPRRTLIAKISTLLFRRPALA